MFLGSAKRLAGWQRFTDYRHEQLAERVLEVEKKVTELLPQPVQNKVNNAKVLFLEENEPSVYMLKKIQEFKEITVEMEEFVAPKIHVCTQSGKSIVPVVSFFIDGVGTKDFFVMAAHKGKERWNVLGTYPTLERALQVYKEMLQCPKDDVYIMPPI